MKVSPYLLLTVLMTLASLTAALAAPPARKSAAKAAPARQAKPAQASPGASSALNSYATQLRQKMGNNWNYPSGTNRVTLTVEAGADGSVSNLTLNSTPKNAEAEQKANDAFNSAQPLQALPAGCSGGATITCTFNSKADQWDHNADISIKIDPKSAPAAGGENEKKEDAKDDKK